MQCDSSKCCVFKKGSKFGMAFGIPNAIFMLALGWAGWLFGYGTTMIEYSSALYHGFSPTFVGGIVGAAWGLVIGYVYGFIFGVVLACCNKGCCGNCGSSSCSMSGDKK